MAYSFNFCPFMITLSIVYIRLVLSSKKYSKNYQFVCLSTFKHWKKVTFVRVILYNFNITCQTDKKNKRFLARVICAKQKGPSPSFQFRFLQVIPLDSILHFAKFFDLAKVSYLAKFTMSSSLRREKLVGEM